MYVCFLYSVCVCVLACEYSHSVITYYVLLADESIRVSPDNLTTFSMYALFVLCNSCESQRIWHQHCNVNIKVSVFVV